MVPFRYSIPYLGFVWDLQNCSVAIPATKKEKYKNMIAEWITNTMHCLKDVQKLYGKLLHASLVVPARRAYLTNLESMLSTFNNRPFVPHHAPRGTTQDLEWWTKTLSLPSVTRAIPGPHEIINTQAYSDASSGVGIAITIGHLPNDSCKNSSYFDIISLSKHLSPKNVSKVFHPLVVP
jgi:hypothetical protein